MSDFLGAKGPTILGNALHNSWYFLVQILRELRRAPPRVLRIMQIISRLGRSLPPSIWRHFHYSHARYNLPKESLCGHFANRLILSPRSSKSTRSIQSIDPSTNQWTSSLICKPINANPPTNHRSLWARLWCRCHYHYSRWPANRSSRLHCLSSIYRDPRQDLHDAIIAAALLNGRLNWFGDCRPRLGIPRAVLIMHQRCLMICRATQSMATTFIGPMEWATVSCEQRARQPWKRIISRCTPSNTREGPTDSPSLAPRYEALKLTSHGSTISYTRYVQVLEPYFNKMDHRYP
jgi:hypothetical protein